MTNFLDYAITGARENEKEVEEMSSGVVVTQMIIMFFFMVIGYVLTKKGKFSETTASDMSFLIINLCCPAMMLSGVLTAPAMSGYELIESGIAVVVIYLLLIAVGAVLGPLLRIPKDKRRYYSLMTVFGNVGFIGYPVINAVIGPEGMGYAALFNLGFNLLIFTYGITMLNQEQSGEKKRVNWKKLINVGTVSGVVAILLLLLRPEAPAPILNCLNYIGSLMTFLSVAIIGHSLANIPLKSVFRGSKVYLFIALRYLALPIVLGIVLKLLVQNQQLANVLLLLLAMPAANTPLMMAQQSGQETETLTRGIVVSTVLSVVTITIATSVVSLV